MKLPLSLTLILGFSYLAQFALAGDFSHVTAHERHEMIRRAQIWTETSVSSKDLFAGPQSENSFGFGETVHCNYVEKKRSGTSPKFHCRLASGEVVKVRYGEGNEEVYAQVAASRLFWALGFAANENYPVHVVCHGCSSDPWEYSNSDSNSDSDSDQRGVLFNSAIIERKVKGLEITEAGKPQQGWRWDELEHVEKERGGASRAQIDALKLLAVFISHVDSHPDNQRIVCPEGSIERDSEGTRCAKPVMYISDLGTTFGGEHEVSDFTTLKLQYWKRWPIWQDPKKCIAYLDPAEKTAGMLRSPKISEAGRKFLADLLSQLTDHQIADLFRVAGVEHVDQNPGFASVEDWVEAFKERRQQIVDHRCSE